MIKCSFAPIISSDSRVLILGSLPGDKSIAQQQYYAHPQNRFWNVIAQLFGAHPTITYLDKVQLLRNNKIALWDVCQSAVRHGSMDSNILDVQPNDIVVLLEKHPGIKHIFFNGQKAAQLFKKHFLSIDLAHLHTLPSTSPANAQYTFPKLCESWLPLKEAVAGNR